jgi:RNA recognition motif-containing protein
VGNLSFDVTREELIEAFGGAGRVVDAKVPTDRETGRPRGFAFVEFEDEESVKRCIQQMDGQDLKGRPLRVNEAEDRPPRTGGGSGFSRGPGPGPGFSRGPGPGSGGPRPSPGHRSAPPPPDFPPEFEKEDRGGGRGKRFRQKPSNRRSSRRRRDQIVDDEDY